MPMTATKKRNSAKKLWTSTRSSEGPVAGARLSRIGT
jgi:hypothetical protein